MSGHRCDVIEVLYDHKGLCNVERPLAGLYFDFFTAVRTCDHVSILEWLFVPEKQDRIRARDPSAG